MQPRRGLTAIVVLAIAAGAGASCGDRVDDPGTGRADGRVADGAAIFDEVAADLGLDHRHDNGMTGEYYFPELVGPGAAFFDYDGDGDLDVYLVQSGPIGRGDEEARRRGDARHHDRLFENRMHPGEPETLQFVDVTARSGLAGHGYGMGVATGDYDGDGHVDLYLTNFGSNQLWRNRGDGTFEDVTTATGTDDPRWSTAAVFVDLGADGHLDLWVVNYVDYRLSDPRRCTSKTGRSDYCGPQNFTGTTDRLLRNRGDGTFEDFSGRAGILGAVGSGLGILAADFDGDRRLDVYVANDLMPNHLWRNLGDARFTNDAVMAGVAVDLQGKAQASMGVEVGDLDGDGDEDLFMTHLTGETNTLYSNDGGGVFTDRSILSGLAAPSLPMTGFGTVLLDFDHDGDLDAMAANGEVRIIEGLARAGDPLPFHQPNQLFEHLGEGRFAELPADRAGPAFALSEVSRGVAAGDIDEDGDLDLLVTQNAGPVRLLLARDRPPADRWIGFRLLDAAGRSDQPGTRVEVELLDGRRLVRRSRAGTSYLSAHDPRVLVGFASSRGPVTAVVTWPSGRREHFVDLATGRYHRLLEGAGEHRE